MEYTKAKALADKIVATLAPYAERIEIAGGVRRHKSQCHDIEVVAVPKFTYDRDMFGDVADPVSELDPHLVDLGRQEKGGARYKQLWLPEGIALDLFLVLPPAEFGVIYTIRTGPADYSRWLVTPKPHGGAMPSHLHCADGALWNGRDKVPTPDERDFYRVLGLEWVAPEVRCPPTRTSPHSERQSL